MFSKKLKKLLLLTILLSGVDAKEYRKFKFYNNTVLVHVIKVNPKEYTLSLEQANNQLVDTRTLEAIATENDADYAINAGFYHGLKFLGSPTSIVKTKNKLWTSTDRKRAAFGWNDDDHTFFFDRLDSCINIELDGSSFTIDAMNLPLELSYRKLNRVLYTKEMLQAVLETKYSCQYLFFDKNKRYLTDNPTSNKIQKAHYLIASQTNRALPSLSENGEFAVDVNLISQIDKNQNWNCVENIIGSTPLLIKDGVILTDLHKEKVLNSFLTLNHARSAVCITKKGDLLFVLVEKHPLKSKGVSICELSQILCELDAQNALNLDGGKSSSLYIKGDCIGSDPCVEYSDYENLQRPIGNALLLKKNA